MTVVLKPTEHALPESMICYILQLLAEQKYPEKLGRVHRVFHVEVLSRE
jgi:hypothetical protein